MHTRLSSRFVVCGLWFGVWGLGFVVCGLGFGVWGLGFGVWGLGFVFVSWVLSFEFGFGVFEFVDYRQLLLQLAHAGKITDVAELCKVILLLLLLLIMLLLPLISSATSTHSSHPHYHTGHQPCPKVRPHRDRC